MNPQGVSTTVYRIYGVVQGVGFRPFVSRIAVRAGLTGSVANKGSYVEVHAQGGDEALKAFRDALVAVDSNVKFGTLVAIKSTLANGNDITTAVKGSKKEVSTGWEVTGANATWRYRAAVYNIAQNNYTQALAATGYFTVHYANNTTKTFYAAFDSTNNVRSLYDVALLASYTDEFKNNSVVQGIVSVGNNMNSYLANGSTSPTVLTAMQNNIGATPTKQVNAGDGCYEAVYTGSNATVTNLSKFRSALTKNGFTLYASNTSLKGTSSQTNQYYTYTNGEFYVNAMYIRDNDSKTPDTTKIVITCEYAPLSSLQGTSATNNYTDKGIATLLTNVGLYYDANVDSEGYATTNFNGLSFVYRLCDGSFIIIDGGFESEGNADRLYNVLRKQQSGSGKIQIAAWIFTHDHKDHVGLFKSFSEKYYKQVTIEQFIYNFASESQSTGASEPGKASIYVTPVIAKYYPNVVIHKAHTGQVYYIRNATITILLAVDAYEPLALSGETSSGSDTVNCNYNCSTMVFQVSVNGVKTLFLGDMQDAEREVFKDMYYKSAYQSTIVQVAHHGIWGCGKGLYEDIGATYTVIPLGHDKALVNGVKWNSVLFSGSSMGNFNDYFISGSNLKSGVYVSEDNLLVFTFGSNSVSAVNQYATVEAYLAS